MNECSGRPSDADGGPGRSCALSSVRKSERTSDELDTVVAGRSNVVSPPSTAASPRLAEASLTPHRIAAPRGPGVVSSDDVTEIRDKWGCSVTSHSRNNQMPENVIAGPPEHTEGVGRP